MIYGIVYLFFVGFIKASLRRKKIRDELGIKCMENFLGCARRQV